MATSAAATSSSSSTNWNRSTGACPRFEAGHSARVALESLEVRDHLPDVLAQRSALALVGAVEQVSEQPCQGVCRCGIGRAVLRRPEGFRVLQQGGEARREVRSMAAVKRIAQLLLPVFAV